MEAALATQASESSKGVFWVLMSFHPPNMGPFLSYCSGVTRNPALGPKLGDHRINLGKNSCSQPEGNKYPIIIVGSRSGPSKHQRPERALKNI